MINSQDKDRISTQPFSTSSMDLFASPQGLDIEKTKRKKKKNHNLLSSYESYIDVAEDHVNECSSKNKQTIEEQKKSKLQGFDESEVHAHSDQEQRKKRPRSQDMDVCDVHVSRDLGNSMVLISSDQEQRKKRKKKRPRSQDMDVCDVHVSRDFGNSMVLISSDQEQRKKRKKKRPRSQDMDVCDVHVSRDLGNSMVLISSDQEQRKKRKKKRPRSQDIDVCDVHVSRDLGNSMVLISSYSKSHTNVPGDSPACTEHRKDKYKLKVLNENESCADSEQEQGHAVKKKNRKHKSIDMDVCHVNVSGDLDDDQNGGVEVYPSRNEIYADGKKGLSEAENKCASDDVHNGDANTKTLSECSNSRKGKEKGFDKNHQCYLCEVSVAGKNNYIKHLGTAHDKPVFQCSQCGRCCTSQEGLSLHQRFACDQEKNLSARVYKCKECPMSYKSNRSLRRHRSEQHNIGGTVREHVCRLCNKSFPRQASLPIHLLKCMKRKKNFVEEGKVEVSCEECQKVFSSRRSLKYHMSTIHEQRLFECSTCGEVFRWSKSLSKHRQKCLQISSDSKSHTNVPEDSPACTSLSRDLGKQHGADI
ncbi:zinc finger protein 774-like isoform X2 [Pomacea canaliculata]|uniref:zinc finger protein 774-like isoform X2 n=1 Tax=Pomacea canaliculata TaxID=400727 RepID=UPI000D727FE8|nr:zinc finger protein 774-like isoform X2 [Pomacea canaliculata]